MNRPVGTVAYMGGVMAVSAEFLWSWGQMVQFNAEALASPGEYVHYDRATVSLHAMARNSLAERMQGEWLLQLDTDHAFEPDLAARLVSLLDAHDLDVLSGLYQFRGPPYSPVLYTWVGEGEDERPMPLGAWDSPDGPVRVIPVAAAGGGCLLVRRRVFDRIREELHEGPFDILPPFGEDISFFMRLRKLGIQAWAAPEVECPHLRLQPVRLTDYDRTGYALTERREFQGLGAG